jgi:hypothetical protein
MPDALLGVLLGGLLSGLGTWITIAIQHKRWITETRIARLGAKREKLEIAYERTLNDLNEGMAKHLYSSKMTSDINFLFPDRVSEAFNKFMEEPNKDDLKMKHHYYNIASTMKQSLKAIDVEIDAIVLGKHGN